MTLPRILLCLLLIAGAGLPLLQARAAADTGQPVVHVATLGGADFDLSGLRGKVVVVHFWATWCPPCITEMPALEAFYRRYRDRGVAVIALSEDRTRDIPEVRKMMHHMDMSYPVAMAHQASANSFGDPGELPVTYVLDAAGNVRATLRPDTQPLTEASLARAVDPLLALTQAQAR
jgi:thiol-disulfide isomerase/thioredoxin